MTRKVKMMVTTKRKIRKKREKFLRNKRKVETNSLVMVKIRMIMEVEMIREKNLVMLLMLRTKEAKVLVAKVEKEASIQEVVEAEATLIAVA